MKTIEQLFASFEVANEKETLIVDNNYRPDSISGLYYENLPEDLGAGTVAEIADRVHDYDKRFYGAFRKDAGERMMGIIEADENHEIGSLELSGEASGLSFNSVWSRPVGDKITKKDCASSFGFGYGLANVKGETAQLKDLGNRLHAALFAVEDEEEKETKEAE